MVLFTAAVLLGKAVDGTSAQSVDAGSTPESTDVGAGDAGAVHDAESAQGRGDRI
jgi:hypothetical protein